MQSSSSYVSSEKAGTMEERQTPKITSPALREACPVIKSKKENKKKALRLARASLFRQMPRWGYRLKERAEGHYRTL